MTKQRKIRIIVLVLILLGVGAVFALFMTGRLVWTDGNTKQVTVKVACGTDIVNRYNDAMYYQERNGSATPSLDEDGIKTLTSDIKKKPGYENDPTCQTMLYWIAVHNNDYDAGNAAYQTVKRLHDQGIFADNNIRANDALFTYEGTLYPLSPAGKAGGGQ